MSAQSTACDTNNDGLIDNSTCITKPAYLRFINTTSTLPFDVYVTGASTPVLTNLVPYQVYAMGPVQATLLGYEFRTSGVTPITGEVNLQANGRYNVAVYLDVSLSPQVLKTSAYLPSTGGCGASSAAVNLGQFTGIASNPVVLFYSSDGGTTWHTPVLPGLNVGQTIDNGCWSGGSLQFGAGPASSTTPTQKYQTTSFTATIAYQMLFTDDRIIRIDSLDRVTTLSRL